MKQSEPFIDRTLMPHRDGRDIDTLLRDFFQAQLPDPWPAPPVAKDKPRALLPLQRPARTWNRVRRQLALAAAVAVFVLGYWTLAALFPTALPDGLRLNPLEQLGNKHPDPSFIPDTAPGVDLNKGGVQNGPETIQTPSGPARVWEQHQNNKIIIRVEALPNP